MDQDSPKHGDQPEPITAFCNGLGRRVRFLRDLYRMHNVALKPGEGLSLALGEATALVAGDKVKEPASQDRVNRTLNDWRVLYAVAESIETCENAGLDVPRYLARLTTGTADCGTPAPPHARTIFLKDFEFELFVASILILQGLTPQLPADLSDPRGELILNNVFIEAKHPNSTGQLEKLLRKLNSALYRDGTFGVFAVTLEDA